MRSAPFIIVVTSWLALAGACQPTDRDRNDAPAEAADTTGVDTPAADTADTVEAADTADTAEAAGSDPAAGDAGAPCRAPEPAARPGTRTVEVYFRCEGALAGNLHPVHRRVDEDADPLRAALEEMLRGPTQAERERGFRSLFSGRTEGMLRSISRSAGGDTVRIDFADFRSELGEGPDPTSFVPGGVMADLTWTVFQQFPDVQALRFAFDGDEAAFWSWLSRAPREPRAFTRTDWEQV